MQGLGEIDLAIQNDPTGHIRQVVLFAAEKKPSGHSRGPEAPGQYIPAGQSTQKEEPGVENFPLTQGKH